jgi:adenosyl cobinamide kinase/adenosyl cobinamide phosphate guanylyltransferase
MITILEGTDATGKSSHAEWLGKQSSGRVIHAGIPQTHSWYTEYIKPIQQHLETTPDIPLILDRWHMGEMIWPTVFHRKSLFNSFEEYDRCNAILAAMQVKMKVLYREADAIINTLMLRNEQDQIDDVLRGQELFMDLVERTSWVDIQVVHSDELERIYVDLL